mgnify:CR=1 FL=1
MALTGIVLIPVLWWFFRQKQTKTTLTFGLVFVLVFSRGTLELLGLSTTVLRLVFEAFFALIFLKGVVFSKGRRLKLTPGLLPLLLFVFASAISALVNQMGLIETILFFRDYLIVILFFYGVLNLTFTVYEKRLLDNLLIRLVAVQVGASLVKYMVLQSISEPYIGTMANLGGSLTVILSLIGVSYCLSNYFVFRERKYVIWVLGFIIFSLIGNKRASIVLFPFIFLFLSYMFQKRFEAFEYRTVKRVLLILILSVGSLYFSIRIMPSLNKERQVWGSFDLEYAMDYSQKYVSTGAGEIEYVGRLGAPTHVFSVLQSDGLLNFSLGHGAGHLIKSKYNSNIGKGGSQQDLTESLYGVGYGARTAFLQLLLQVGFAGLGFYVLMIVQIFRFSKRFLNRKLSQLKERRDYVFFSGLWVVFVIDFFGYSVTMVQISAVSLLFFWFLATQYPVPSYNVIDAEKN